MHLLPFAVLGGEAAPADMPQKVLLVTPNLGEQRGAALTQLLLCNGTTRAW